MTFQDSHHTNFVQKLRLAPESDQCSRLGLQRLVDFRSSRTKIAWSHILCENKHVGVMTTPLLKCRESYAKAVSNHSSSMQATQIATHAGLVPNPAVDPASTSIASNAAARDDLAASKPPATRGTRGQLAYDTLQDAHTARRLGNRTSAARRRAREAEAALARSRAEMVMLQEQLAVALCFIEQLGYSAPLAALSATESLPALELPPSPSEWGL